MMAGRRHHRSDHPCCGAGSIRPTAGSTSASSGRARVISSAGVAAWLFVVAPVASGWRGALLTRATVSPAITLLRPEWRDAAGHGRDAPVLLGGSRTLVKVDGMPAGPPIGAPVGRTEHRQPG